MLTATDEFILLQVQSSNQFIAGAERGRIRFMKYAELAPDTGSDEKRRNIPGLGLPDCLYYHPTGPGLVKLRDICLGSITREINAYYLIIHHY